MMAEAESDMSIFMWFPAVGWAWTADLARVPQVGLADSVHD